MKRTIETSRTGFDPCSRAGAPSCRAKGDQAASRPATHSSGSAGRFGHPLVGQALRASDQVDLNGVAADLAQKLELGGRFDAFGEDPIGSLEERYGQSCFSLKAYLHAVDARIPAERFRFRG